MICSGFGKYSDSFCTLYCVTDDSIQNGFNELLCHQSTNNKQYQNSKNIFQNVWQMYLKSQSLICIRGQALIQNQLWQKLQLQVFFLADPLQFSQLEWGVCELPSSGLSTEVFRGSSPGFSWVIQVNSQIYPKAISALSWLSASGCCCAEG